MSTSASHAPAPLISITARTLQAGRRLMRAARMPVLLLPRAAAMPLRLRALRAICAMFPAAGTAAERLVTLGWCWKA